MFVSIVLLLFFHLSVIFQFFKMSIMFCYCCFFLFVPFFFILFPFFRFYFATSNSLQHCSLMAHWGLAFFCPKKPLGGKTPLLNHFLTLVGNCAMGSFHFLFFSFFSLLFLPRFVSLSRNCVNFLK